ncbi:MAG: bifunctional precorrin-2 dehydrogenase/sirohydrochlorin ferrochelatase [Dehalococcoidales bacterium]|nr:bifunctional precorrin-2 dehydrogenase/sirohydrochlorin ferrochelatase [Dehalococcoidales bacterium]
MKEGSHKFPYYPIFLDIYGKKCVVIGGGKVALRKVKLLLEHGSNVEVVSPTLCPELSQLAENGSISVVNKNYEPGVLAGAFIAIAATTEADTNEKVAEEARRRGILVNVVDNPQQSDFIVPSSLRRGDITIAISTMGKSPALAKKIRTRLEQNFGEEYTSLVILINEVRTELKQQGIIISGNAWQEALDLDSLLKLVRAGRREEAKTALLNNLERLRQIDIR